ncbi:DNA polymerase theta isoform X2 [Pararge aegeria]|uniref:DNA polymerase theta isoform X2 n=1 Tax=Pararge aegeria TaxID=116150 RepID=UPI0019D30E8A|nr:DNA polymerase theta isoform X2 [Pararge aegeria]
MEEKDEMDLLQLTDNVSFLAECFNNSFDIQSSLKYIKDCVHSEPRRFTQKQKLLLSRRDSLSQTIVADKQNSSCKVELVSQLKGENRTFNKNLKNWGLPYEITNKYEKKGIVEMFDWQVDCLGNPKVLLDCHNLVYSAPTSAGKTLVAEILAIKTVLERQKKVIFILPFVSIVREKMFYLQDILSSSGVRVEGFMGSQSPPGGLQAVHIAICTIEKANSLVNKLLDDGNISDLGAVIVDELHLLGDPHRGYILELLLTKVKYISSKLDNMKIQIIGMSATLPNLEVLANWLKAELYITEFRPIPLNEYCLVGNKYYDKNGKYTDLFNKAKMGLECDYVLSLCLETIKEGCSILIFCMTKNRCENLAQSIASSFYKLGCSENEHGTTLREQLNSKNIFEVLEQLKNCPVGLDQILKNIISFGVAYHHAGLTFDERDIIEGAFKSSAIRVLVATSTLSSGVNLPARKVIIRSPVFQKHPINILTYKQMIGRAGRMGKDTQGESVLICTAAEQKIGFELMMGTLDPVLSCIESKDKFMRAILEIIASQDVCNKSELDLYTKCTLLCAQKPISTSQNDLLEDTLKELINYELVRIQTKGHENKYVATSFGKACLSSSMAPNDGLSLFCEIQKARQCLVLETDLHLIYLVTPYSVSNQWNDIDWLHLLTLWESLTAAMKRVGELVGVQESFIIRCLRSSNKSNNNQNKLNIHKRFYTALALQDLVNEVPLSEVACKFQCARGFLQGLQQSAATFAGIILYITLGMVTAFCHQLGWKNMETLVSQFQDRLQFGIHSELLELMKLASLNGIRARTLFDAGFETISSVALADVNVIENALHKSMPFQSEKEREGDEDIDVRKRNKIKNIWITGCCGMTAREAAANIILEARKYLIQDIGVSEIKWKDLSPSNSLGSIDTGKFIVDNNQRDNKDVLSRNNIKQPTAQVNVNDEIHCKNNISLHINVENSLDRIITSFHTSKQNENDHELNSDINVNKTNNILSIKNDDSRENEKDLFSRNVSAPIKEDLMWESLNLTGTVLENISKPRTSGNFFSPNISFGEGMDSSISLEEQKNDTFTLKSTSAKDISLFSSEGDNSNIFEESLITDTLIEHKVLKFNAPSNNVQTCSDYIDINSKSILNAFLSTIIKVEEDEDIKLVYDDETGDSKEENRNNFDKSQEHEILNTQDFKEPKLKNRFISPLKRSCYTSKDNYSLAKKSKSSNYNLMHETEAQFKLYSSKSMHFTLNLAKNYVNCYILRENDVNINFININNATGISIILDTSCTLKKSSDIIGNNIVFKKPVVGQQKDKGEEVPIIKGIALCLKRNLCVYLDLTSLAKGLLEFKNKISLMFSNVSFKLKMLCTKANYVLIKKWLGKDLLSSCTDITLTEWLLDSDERISKIIDLTKKYCDIDLPKSQINVKDKMKNYNDLDVFEVACLRAWCIFAIAEKQSATMLSKYKFPSEALNTEIHVAKILGNCEYYGINVDKNLASQLLIDVKNSQEVLQKNAYKLCGYHFNFNSSKDVAKALGIYKGRKVSTKKSVLCAHNSPMASVVIYWRKLNSILTKTLYPLTEQAFYYSANNRINPSYTMFTCTGRISMHEPNLQNVPRTFTVPLRYLEVLEDNAPCDDVIEFNCRNIFKSSQGYVFVSADYCQLEMRILTHYCKDVVLTRIMSSDVDVFKSIAASWSGVPEKQVDDDLRQKAKQLCYGILYGMGNRTLAQHLDVNEIEAAVFMDTFYKSYPAVKVFTQSVIDECRKNGYVETLMKRRRYLPDINSNIVSKRNTAERQAVNTTIQGSAADIAKAAMCALDTNTNADVDKPRLILQMHDELVYEVIESNKMNFVHTIKNLMEDTVHLNVPLPVKVKTGCTWGSMEEVKF